MFLFFPRTKCDELKFISLEDDVFTCLFQVIILEYFIELEENDVTSVEISICYLYVNVSWNLNVVKTARTH